MLRTLLALLLIASSVLVATPAHAAGTWSDGPCSDSLGVTVAVDYGGLGGGTAVHCAENFAAAVAASGRAGTGLDALVLAGFGWAPAQRQPGAVCRVNGRPAAAETLSLPNNPSYREACVQMPPETAFWSYWTASVGGSWSFSSSGAGGRLAQPGGFEGWRFHLGSGSASAPAVRTVRGTARPANEGTDTATAGQTATAAAPTTATVTRTAPATTARTTAAGGTARTTTAPATAGTTAKGTTTPATTGTATVPTTAPPATASTAASSAAPETPGATVETPAPSRDATDTASASPSERPVPADTPTSTPGPTQGTGGGTSTLGGLAAVAAVALVGGGAAWALRRRRG